MTDYPTNNLYGANTPTSPTGAFVTHFDTRDPLTTDVNWPVQKRWFNKTLNREWILTGFTTISGFLQADWAPIESSSVVETLTGNSGGAVGPNGSNTIFVVGDTTTTNVVGNPGTNTLTISTTGSVPISFVTDSGTATPSGGVLDVNGGTGINTSGSGHQVVINLTTPVTVPEGGTGDTSFTAYSVICGGTTSTGNLQNVSGVGTSGQVLTSNGAATLPTWQNFPGFASINVQVFTSSGTYTPTSGMSYCIIECVGGGGGGGGTTTTSPGSALSGGGGGGGGGYARKFASAATIGASQTVTIGDAGTAGATSGGNGGNGGSTSVGVICVAGGGSGGSGAGTFNHPPWFALGGAGGTGTTGDLLVSGQTGGNSTDVTNYVVSGAGGTTLLGSGAAFLSVYSGQTAGNAGSNYGSGGSGGATGPTANNVTGGAGAKGVVVITEFIT